MSDNKRSGRSSGRGYYIALILCAAAIGITSYVYQRNTKAVQETALQETQPETIPIQLEQTEDVPVLATTPRETQPPATTVPPTTVPEREKALKTISPLEGQELMGYSMEALSYHATTRDWRVHDGVDIAAEPGTPVCAAADGEVSAVYQDDSLGQTVVIRHTGGYVTCYASLGSDIPVSAGDRVSAGQTIGYAGESALLETALGSHVHFGVSKQDASVDPAEFLALGE